MVIWGGTTLLPETK
jgi:hypothetical protein